VSLRAGLWRGSLLPISVTLPAPAVFVGDAQRRAAHPTAFEGEGSPPDPRLTLMPPFGYREAPPKAPLGGVLKAGSLPFALPQIEYGVFL